MEFSYDRSRESQARSTTANQAPTQPQRSEAPRPGPDLNTVDSSTIANERLRKAIERNRSKQAGREAQKPAQQSSHQEQGSFYSQSSHLSQEDQAHIQYAQQASQAANSEREMPKQDPRQDPTQETQSEAAQSPRARLRARMAAAASSEVEDDTPPMPTKGTGLVSRRSVARPDDTEFVPVKRTPKKVASQISYTTASTRKKQNSMDPKYVNWLVKGSWIFCSLMVLRLIFAAGGVTDFYSQKSSVIERVNELNFIKKENMTLVREIERMRSDAGFQKKLVRDNLGFIASDEFLVLFPK